MKDSMGSNAVKSPVGSHEGSLHDLQALFTSTEYKSNFLINQIKQTKCTLSPKNSPTE